MKRLHRTLLVLNYAVSYQDEDHTSYMEWAQLKKLLTRSELIQLIRNVRAGRHYMSAMSNPLVSQVIGV
jgi:hypothetical protein